MDDTTKTGSTKVLVAVASKHGSTREIADAIAEELRAEHLTVDLRDLEGAAAIGDISAYDAVVFGSAIYAANWLPEAKQFAEQYRAALAGLPVWLFSSGPLGAEDPKPQDDPSALAAPLGDVKVRDHRIFVGKLDMDKLAFPERLLTKVVGAPAGDFRDWDEIRGWARGIASSLQAEVAAARR
jgi:menaquinone-dependent protoporphyrinogen oxidase